jgi:hypothetical protein
LPPFICGNENKKEDKIIVCYNGNNLCVDRKAAEGFIEKGAYLGGCGSESLTKTVSAESSIENTKLVPGSNLLNVYPNPASGNVSISFTTTVTSKTKLELYDMSGKLVKNLYEGVLGKDTRQKIELQTRSLPAGIYMMSLQTGNRIVKQSKLVVTN